MGLPKSIFTIFLSFLLLTQAWAIDTSVAHKEKVILQDIQFEMKFHNLVLKMAEEIDRELGDNFKMPLEEEKMEELFRRKVLNFAEFYESHYEIPKSKMQKVKKLLQQEINWKEVKKLVNSTNLGLQSFFKKHGFGVALAMVLGYLSDFVIVIFSGALGLTKLMAISPFIPYALIYATIPTIGTKIKMRKKLIEALGGKRAYNAYIEQMRLTARELKMGNPYRWVFPSVNYLFPIKTGQGVVDSLVITKSAAMSGLAGKLGLNIKELNYSSLKIWLTTEGIKSDYIKWVSENESLQRWQKVALIVEHLVNEHPQDVVNSLRLRFSDSFVRIKKVPYWGELKSWTKEMMKAKDITEVKSLLLKVPPETKALEVMTIWDEMILPSYSDRTEIGYFQYRKISEESEIIKAKAYSSKSSWNEEFIQEMFSLLSKNFKHESLGNCTNSPNQVLFYLLKGI